VIVAAGRGVRFGQPKQFFELAGLPMVGWSIRAFARMPEVAELIVVTETEYVAQMQSLIERVAPQRTARVVEGAGTRQGSVRNGVLAVSAACQAVLVHDGARPLVRARDVRAAMAEVREGRGSLLAAPVVDTIKVVDDARMSVTRTLDRATLWAAQTPQLALTADLLDAHERAVSDGIEATDDAALLERIGVEVVVVPASSENFKVTLPEDVARAEAFLRERLAQAAR
jgi:2-C-methyl-D-erythritol 4-phosphate cytidylyltransferase